VPSQPDRDRRKRTAYGSCGAARVNTCNEGGERTEVSEASAGGARPSRAQPNRRTARSSRRRRGRDRVRRSRIVRGESEREVRCISSAIGGGAARTNVSEASGEE